MRVLGIESSCDELAMAILEPDGRTLLANVIHSQVELHRPFGGIVPEVAARDHVRSLNPVLARTLDAAKVSLDSVDGVAVTAGPGLIGPLLCGVEFAKGLALGLNRPLVGVHHLEGHIAAVFLEDPAPTPPFVALLVSGGHTNLIFVEALGGPYLHLGATRDDAAGEAFDKTAKLLGLGYPGGAEVDRRAQQGDPRRFEFPALMAGKDNLDFSFSGLKTAARRILSQNGPLDAGGLADFCASFQRAVVDNLITKAFRAVRRAAVSRLVLAGGVAANSELRRRSEAQGRRENVHVYLPSRSLCTDNAAMIARAGQPKLVAAQTSGWDLTARATWPLFVRRASARRSR